ncbi:DNA helicase RecG, partial [Candidatus Parcubacteria bacterium]|nr:DNA helicase RecG [Candidatus Parcubacteria bacterium]
DISKTQLLKWVQNGEIPILIGTHALIQKSVQWKNLALAIIDEQHRFGTKQRGALAVKREKGKPAPHLLSMTATPIPRTLALTIYGSLDLTLLDEMPPGRKHIKTEIVLPGKRAHVYEKMREELGTGRQAYVICPRIDEPDPTKELALMAKSAKAEAVRLDKEVFPEYRIAVLHGKMSDSEKEETMEAFVRHEIDILVSTSLVEVGVNVPNATVILIEGAERFGLAQLHQLRGRVLRSTHQSYCFLFSETKSKKSLERLKAIEKAKTGFELAELDLALRGAGELGGEKQWGLSDLAMEAMKNLKMVEAARTEAAELVKTDPELSKFLKLKSALASRAKPIHFE